MYFLRAVKHILSRAALKSVYYATVQCTFSLHLWHPHLELFNQSQLNKLFLKQKMAVCILTLSEYNSHTEPLFKKVEILSLPTLIEYFKLQFMHRFVVNWLPRSFESTWSRNAERRLDPNQVVLRNNEDLFIPPSRLSPQKIFPYSVFHASGDPSKKLTLNAWYMLMNLIPNWKKHFLSKLSSSVICNRLLCPHCHLLPQ